MNHAQCTGWMVTVLLVAGGTHNVEAQEKDGAPLSAELKPDSVIAAMERVADWQLAQYNAADNTFREDPSSAGHPQGWVYGALFAGMTKWAAIAESSKYWDVLFQIAERNAYLFGPRVYHADDYAIGQLYLDLYEQNDQAEYLAPLKTNFETIMRNPCTLDLKFATAKKVYDAYGGRSYGIAPCMNRWCWADALFMGPPVWTHLAKVTGDMRYLEFSDKEVWATVDYLFDKEEHLFYRDSRYFVMREPNGAKLFWGRGNGWVLAGLARILEHLPKNHPSRGRYEDVFRKMAAKFRSTQTLAGYWPASLLAPELYPGPETSGTGFIVFGLAWGVNGGILPADVFDRTIRRGWQGLIDAVHENGKLGWVQQVASAPGSATKDDTHLFGVGAFLLAGSEVYRLAGGE